ncbi:substrate-binding periplasmic protein [Terasakiella sp.]|uniref:substrate-binding periplasmic protein n=1 Tax=Terasakiella sp. TaxID=2034861 RepID=UPI003AA811B9
MRHRLFLIIFGCLLSLTVIKTAWSEDLLFFTEHYPPYNFIGSEGEVSGISTEIVQEIMKRTGFAYRIKLTPWKRAYELTLSQKNTCLFTTGRTKERDNLFKWVTPLTENPIVLFAQPTSTIKITQLSDLSEYRIGGYLGDAAVDYLVTRNIPVETVRDDKLNVRKLQGGRIDLWVTGEMAGHALANKTGDEIKKIFKLTAIAGGIACNLHLSDLITTRLQQELHALYQEGFIERVYHKYDPNLSVPIYKAE